MSAEVFVKAHSLCDCGGKRRASRRRRENQWSCWRPSSRPARHSHSHSSRGFLLLCIPQLDPFFLFFPLSTNSAPEFLSSRAGVCLFFYIFLPFPSPDSITLRATSPICIRHSPRFGSRNLRQSLNVQLMRALNIMNNNYPASYCNNTQTGSHDACTCIVLGHNCP